MQDDNGNRVKLKAKNPIDRLNFDEPDSKKVHDALMKGGTIKFVIINIADSTDQYKFTVKNADWYENAYIKLNVLRTKALNVRGTKALNVRGTKALKAGQWKNGLYKPFSLWEQLMDK